MAKGRGRGRGAATLVSDTIGRQASVLTRVQGAAVAKAPRRGAAAAGAEGKWQHDMFEDDVPVRVVRGGRAGAARGVDLRQTLSRRGGRGAGRGALRSVVVGDLRARLSGSPAAAPRRVVSVGGAAANRLVTVTKRSVASTIVGGAASTRVRKNADMTLPQLLSALGLSKYQSLFQQEEVDMAALRQMTEADLEALGIPMGPRKKIIAMLA